MRKALVFLLLASAAVPGFASAADAAVADPGDRRDPIVQRGDEDDNGTPQRPARPARIAHPDDNGEQPTARQLRRARRSSHGDAPSPVAPPPAVAQQSDAPTSLRGRRSRERFRENSPGAIQERNRNGADVIFDRLRRGDTPVVSRTPRAGTQPPPRSANRWRETSHRWRGDWRSDRRYDWRSHRRRYHWLFNLGYYRDPFGWGYQPFSIGWRMWPSYYGHSYWLRDPWRYRLPYAPPGYRWIRYYDDAILVDTWDGQVVDVIRNFFW